MECLDWISSFTQDRGAGNNGTGKIRLNDDGGNSPVDILALGSGWTWTFLNPAAQQLGYRTAFTTRDGNQGSIPFTFDPESDDASAFENLPDAQTIVVVFPLYTEKAAQRLVHGYVSTRSEAVEKKWRQGDRSIMMEKYSEKMTTVVDQLSRTRFILLGSTGIWDSSGPTARIHTAPIYPTTAEHVVYSDWPQGRSSSSSSSSSHKHHRKPHGSERPWVDRHSAVDRVPRSIAEDAFLAFNNGKSDAVPTSVLCLSGLWGHGRSPRRFIGAIAPTKERVAQLGSVHFIHGHDVARAILAMHQQWDKAAGQRWMLTNERVYDLWDLISQWGNAGEAGRAHVPKGPQPGWVQELINESRTSKDASDHIRSLPRTAEQLGFAMDGTDFWTTFGLHPEVPWVD